MRLILLISPGSMIKIRISKCCLRYFIHRLSESHKKRLFTLRFLLRAPRALFESQPTELKTRKAHGNIINTRLNSCDSNPTNRIKADCSTAVRFGNRLVDLFISFLCPIGMQKLKNKDGLPRIFIVATYFASIYDSRKLITEP